MVSGWPVAEWWARACLPGALRPQPVMPHVRHATTLTRMLHTEGGEREWSRGVGSERGCGSDDVHRDRQKQW